MATQIIASRYYSSIWLSSQYDAEGILHIAGKFLHIAEQGKPFPKS